MRGEEKQGGFTLLEILVALAVVAIALSALIGETSRNLENTARLRDHTLGHWVAMNVVAEQHVSGDWPSVGVRKGSSLMAGREWYWTLTVTATADRNVRRMDVAVFGERRRKKERASLIAYIGSPMK